MDHLANMALFFFFFVCSSGLNRVRRLCRRGVLFTLMTETGHVEKPKGTWFLPACESIQESRVPKESVPFPPTWRKSLHSTSPAPLALYPLKHLSIYNCTRCLGISMQSRVVSSVCVCVCLSDGTQVNTLTFSGTQRTSCWFCARASSSQAIPLSSLFPLETNILVTHKHKHASL